MSLRRKPQTPESEHLSTPPSDEERARLSLLEHLCIFVFSCVVGTLIFGMIGRLLTGSVFWGFDVSLVEHRILSFFPPPPPVCFSKAELSKFDGSDPALPIYLAVKGQVFDVTAGGKHYGVGGGYHGFAGRDASRAFLDLCFTAECLETADKLEDLSVEQMKEIDNWVSFYSKDPKYKFVGRLC